LKFKKDEREGDLDKAKGQREKWEHPFGVTPRSKVSENGKTTIRGEFLVEGNGSLKSSHTRGYSERPKKAMREEDGSDRRKKPD